MGTRKDPKLKELAYMLYMAGESQKVIAEKVGCSTVTLSKWVTTGMWENKRAAGTVTRGELINKCLKAVATLLDNNIEDPDPSLPDKLSKLASTIASLDKKNNVVNDIETFMGFNNYLQAMIKHDKTLSIDLVKVINRYQDNYVIERMSGK